MNDFAVTQVEFAMNLIVGSSILLSLGSLAVLLARRPAFRQRAAETTVLVTAVWILLAAVPLPRVAPFTSTETQPASIEMVTPETLVVEIDPGQNILPATEASASVAEPAFAADTSANRPATNHAWPQIVWFGCLLVSVCLLGWVVLARVAMTIACMRSQGPPPWIEQVYDDLSKRTQARVVISERNIRPMSFGVLRPVIMLPIRLRDESCARTLRHVLLHEQAHIDRRDAIGNTILILSMPLLWCHPLYWYLRHTVNLSRELIADDVAADQTDKLTYVADLVDLLRHSSRGGATTVPGAIGVLGFRHPFTRRMSDLLERAERLPVKIGALRSLMMYATGACALALATAVLGVSSGIGQEVTAQPATDVAQQQPAADQSIDAEPAVAKPIGTPALSTRFRFEHAVTRPATDLMVTAPDDGSITVLHVQPGQAIRKGDVVIAIVNPELEQALTEATQNVLILQQNLSGDVNIRDAKMSLTIAMRELQLLRGLQQDGSATSSEILKSEQGVDRAKLRIELAESQKKKHELELQRDQSVLKQLRNRVSRLQVRAPSDGIIESLNVNVGQSIRRGDRLFRLVSLDKVRVEFDVPSDKVFAPSLLMQKMSFTARSPSERPITLTGTVAFVSSEVDIQNQSRAWAICDNVRRDQHWAVRSGVVGQVTVGAATPPDEQTSLREGKTNRSTDDARLLKDLRTQEGKYLEELVVSLTAMADVASAHLENGTGTRQRVEAARRDLWRTKAELAIARGEHDKVAAAYEKAIEFAEAAERDFATEVNAGRGSMLELSLASQRKAEIKLDFLRYKRTRLAK